MVSQYIPSDFQVEELIEFPDESGDYSYYRVEKKDTTVTAVRKAMASTFKVTPSAVVFPALRDFSARAVQYASVRKVGPVHLEGKGYSARRIKQGPRALSVKDLLGNKFTINLHHLDQNHIDALKEILDQIGSQGLPNYFGKEKFLTVTEDGFIGKAILLHQAERVIRLYLAAPMLKDSKQIRQFKHLVSTHWGQWGFLFHKAPRPSNYRSVIAALKDHPHDYEKAANIIRDQRLAEYLCVYQSWVWNHILAHYLRQNADVKTSISIVGAEFPLISLRHNKDILDGLSIDLPRLTVHYTGALAEAAEAALGDEGLTVRDFNVRMMRRVCLTKCERNAWFAPTDIHIREDKSDAQPAEGRSIQVRFTLPVEHYATLVMKATSAYLDTALSTKMRSV